LRLHAALSPWTFSGLQHPLGLCGVGRDNLRCRLWLEAVQPVKEIHEHFQGILLAGLHQFEHVHPLFLHTRVILEPKVFSLERDGIVKEILWSIFEAIRDSVLGGVVVEGIENVGEYEGGVPGWNLGEYGGHSGEGSVGADSGAWDVPLAKMRMAVMESM
jgi:hypothetical protein